MNKGNQNRIRTVAIAVLLALFDIVAANLAYGFALLLRFEFKYEAIPENYLESWLHFSPMFAVLVVVVFAFFHLYNSVWRYVSYVEMLTTLVACVILALLQVAGTVIFFCRMPAVYYVLGGLVMFVLLMGIRVAYRSVRVINRTMSRGGSLESVIIVGSGEAGRLLLREIRLESPLKSNVVCFADDAPGRIGKVIDGVTVRGTVSSVPELVKKYGVDRVIIAIPSASNKRLREIFEELSTAGCEINIVSKSSLTDNIVDLNEIKKVRIEDLLGRDEINIDNTQVINFFKGKTVLVTGGGGSIGSELVRQVASYNPDRMIIFDIYENSTYAIQLEIRRKYPDLPLDVIIGSVSNEEMIRSIVFRYRPDVIYHAAAHKHVPLMESVPLEAVTNNVLGTYYTAKAAADADCAKFVLISTDKAVNPTNIMGASKRMCEMVIKVMDDKYDTEFAAVRFGNVLGSNGSVIPLFTKQIENGGPVTVTHPDITRFFMTIPEAVSLVLQAGAFAKGGELFVLDMGEPVKIDKLARDMIRMSGFVPDVDIKIEYTGLRPGEKLYEELMMEDEGLTKTDNNLIFIGEQIEIPDDFIDEILSFEDMGYEDMSLVVSKVRELVDTYRPEL